MLSWQFFRPLEEEKSKSTSLEADENPIEEVPVSQRAFICCLEILAKHPTVNLDPSAVRSLLMQSSATSNLESSQTGNRSSTASGHRLSNRSSFTPIQRNSSFDALLDRNDSTLLSSSHLAENDISEWSSNAQAIKSRTDNKRRYLGVREASAGKARTRNRPISTLNSISLSHPV
ncbi:hypothetical protein BC829DRAFT_185112 [Chytridium lagenaria]|nr:hypothetical protein BC829DRAFT_185112 [Chytridium lagenaria]